MNYIHSKMLCAGSEASRGPKSDLQEYHSFGALNIRYRNETRVRKGRECKQSLASAKGRQAIATSDLRSPSHQNIWTEGTILGSQKTLQSQFSFNILTIFVGRHWRQNSTTVEQVARFQRLFPNPSWLMSGRKNIQFQYLFIWNQIFPGIDNCLMGTKC